MLEARSFFSQHGLMSRPGKHAGLLKDMPSTLPELVRIVQNAILHVAWAGRYGYQVPPERLAELQLHSMEDRLGALMELDPCPLTEERPVEKRQLGNCRDFALMLVMILRQQGIPARARCGFAAYFQKDHFEDHWVAEYWNEEEQRWILVDAQLDALQCEALKISFNPLDVPRDQFLVGGHAWQLCRAGKADPAKFGIADMHGLWFVRGDLVRDTASLNKMELLPWDCWGLGDSNEDAMPDLDSQFLDEVAELTREDVPKFDKVRSLYENDPRLRVPGEIRSYTAEGPRIFQIPVT